MTNLLCENVEFSFHLFDAAFSGLCFDFDHLFANVTIQNSVACIYDGHDGRYLLVSTRLERQSAKFIENIDRRTAYPN